MYFYENKGQNGSAFTEKQLIVVPNSLDSMKQKIKFFVMRPPKVMRAGTGNKNFFIWPNNEHITGTQDEYGRKMFLKVA